MPAGPDLRAFARWLRSNGTDAERLLWSRLRGRRFHGLKFRRQHPPRPYIPDFYRRTVSAAGNSATGETLSLQGEGGVPRVCPNRSKNHGLKIRHCLGFSSFAFHSIRIDEIAHARRAVTADTALRIGKALGTTPDFWLNLQGMYDLDRARNALGMDAIETLVAV